MNHIQFHDEIELFGISNFWQCNVASIRKTFFWFRQPSKIIRKHYVCLIQVRARAL